MNEMFDIYLAIGCRTIPDLTDITGSIQLRARPEWRNLLMSEKPGFLGLNLPRKEATALIARLRYSEARASGIIVPTRYRDEEPRLSVEEARSIAEAEIERYKREHPTAKLEHVELKSQNVIWYAFTSTSKEWVRKGKVPGALSVCVDKLDGHIWKMDEKDNLFDVLRE